MTTTTATRNDTRTTQIERSLELARVCARTADGMRATDVKLLDLTGVTPIVDFFVICTGTSRRQMHAIAEEVNRVMKEHGSRRLGIEGYEASAWILQDYGDIVLHVFDDETRETYDLERLWADAKPIAWQPDGSAASDDAEE